ncbi:MAG: sugar phosphate isomerase/epimerase [Bryobacteraceae bacterium]|nr:sugar phosphate isomerase/epimerase [Bryobacteraceae bacterium]MDW8379307.1 sugar phosphate isomerase/epimerase [Bryobacterales bacterium]
MKHAEFTRRQVFRSLFAFPVATSLQAAIDSTVRGVMIGAQSYSFRDRSLDDAIQAMQEIGLGFCELWSGHVEPTSTPQKRIPREEIRMWRKTVSLDHFRQVREKFRRAGIVLYAYNYSFRDDFDEQEIARGFEFAKALGVQALTASSNVSTAKRIDPYARKAKVPVGMHNHSRITPNEFATPEDFEQAMRGMSRYIAVNLDIGHFTAANFDPVSFLEKHHKSVVTLHIKDRKKDQGPNVPFGEGDTKIKEVLQLLRDKKWKIPAMIEYEYKGADTVAEVRRCYEYCRKVLEKA